MPKRKSVVRHETDEVQGEDSYVVVTGIKVKEIRRLREMVRNKGLEDRNKEHREKGEPEEESVDQFEESLLLIARHIVDWNWIDDDEASLPSPKEHPEVMDELTNEEAVFLTELMIGKEAAKN